MKRFLLVFVLGWTFTLVSLQAHAVFIDFDSHASTTTIGGDPGAAATVTNDYAADGVVFGRAGVSAGIAVVNNTNTFSDPNGACGLDAAGNIPFACSASIYFEFVNGGDAASTDLVEFTIGDSGGDLDSWSIRVFDIDDTLLEARAVASNANTTQSFAHSGMHRFEVIWTAGTTAGYLLDNLSFNAPTAVPVLSSLGLFALGLLGMWGNAGRRRAIAA